MSSNRAIHDLKKRTEAARLYRLDNKRVRRDKPEVEVCSRTGGGGRGALLGKKGVYGRWGGPAFLCFTPSPLQKIHIFRLSGEQTPPYLPTSLPPSLVYIVAPPPPPYLPTSLPPSLSP